jgi:hypothetical protein
MSVQLLTDFMKLVLDITGAERGLAVDTEMTICAMANLDEDTAQSPKFSDLALQALSDAMTDNEAVITNNIITDPSQAPTTNTNFSHLRFVVAIPLPQVGAVYVDQPIRNGVISRDPIEKLRQLGEQVAAQASNTPNTDLRALYDQMSA